MSVQKIEEYRQKDGTDILKVFCKPTKNYSIEENYFYVDAKDKDIVDNYTWGLIKAEKNTYVGACTGSIYDFRNLKLHRELAYKYLGYYPDYIDHINGVAVDNVDENLNVVTNQQNAFNKPSRGYNVNFNRNSFAARVVIMGRTICLYSSVHLENEVCQLQYKLETEYLRDVLQDDYYVYDFLKDRRNDLDILDLERTGQISSDGATYRHVIRYAKDNAWYYYRYNLEQYFKDNHIPVPDFDLDERGFMIDKITRKKLCPF